jgi:hypothetical protein
MATGAFNSMYLTLPNRLSEAKGNREQVPMFPAVTQTNSLLALNQNLNASPGPANRVGFSVEDNFLEVKRLWWREKQIEILERLGEQETMH